MSSLDNWLLSDSNTVMFVFSKDIISKAWRINWEFILWLLNMKKDLKSAVLFDSDIATLNCFLSSTMEL